MARKAQDTKTIGHIPQGALVLADRVGREVLQTLTERMDPDERLVVLADWSMIHAARLASLVGSGPIVSLDRKYGEIGYPDHAPMAERVATAFLHLNQALAQASIAKREAATHELWFTLIAESKPCRLGVFDGYSWAVALSYATEVHRQIARAILGEVQASKLEEWHGPRVRAGHGAVFMDSEPLTIGDVSIDSIVQGIGTRKKATLETNVAFLLPAQDRGDVRRENGSLHARLLFRKTQPRMLAPHEVSTRAKTMVARVFADKPSHDSAQTPADSRAWTLSRMMSLIGGKKTLRNVSRYRKDAGLQGGPHRAYSVFQWRQIVSMMRSSPNRRATGNTLKDAAAIEDVLDSNH